MTYAARCRYPMVQLAAIVAAALALTGAGAAGAATYKWVDDQGAVHYSDHVPPEAQTKGATVLDKQGRPLRRIEPAPTPEQRKAKEAEAEQQRALAKVQEDRARKDRALMQSYTTEAEIDVAKARALGTIDTQIKAAQAYSTDLARRQQELEKKKAGYGTKPVPIEVERDLNVVDVELSRQATLIEQKTRDIVTVTAKYDADRQRWQEIKTDQQRAAAAAAANAAAAAAQAPGKTAATRGPGTPATAATK